MQTKKDEIIKSTKETLEGSSIHAIPNIVRNEHYLIKIVWFICFLISSGWCTYFIQQSVADYLNYDVVTKIDIKYETKLKFPIVSICNLNLFNTDYVNGYLTSLLDEKENFDMNTFKSVKALASDHENRTLFGKKLNEFLVNCYIKVNQNCNNESLFEHYYDVNYGNCYRYNSGRNRDGNTLNIEYIYQNGVQTALELELLIGKSSINNNMFSIENGFMIFISDEPVDSTSHQGIKISPGFSYSIIIDKYNIQNEPKPYTNCIGDLTSIDSYQSESYKKTYRFGSNKTYHYTDCLQICFQKLLAEKCKCQTRFYSMVFDENMIKCESMNSTLDYSTCVSNRSLEFAQDSSIIDLCDCPLECKSSGYGYTISFAEFPTHKYYTYASQSNILSPLISPLIPMAYYYGSDEILFNEISRSVARVVIFYDELKETRIEQNAKTKLPDLVSNIGGTLGLYIGLSFLSLVEIFEILLQILIISFQKKKVTNNSQE